MTDEPKYVAIDTHPKRGDCQIHGCHARAVGHAQVAGGLWIPICASHGAALSAPRAATATTWALDTGGR
jgi:hypothetical protein